MRTQSLATSLILVAAGLLVPAVADASTPIAATCGAVLTTDAYLNRDLSCPGQRGVSVSGNITIDLRNHVLRGSKDIGIAILDGYSAQVRNGTVRGWGIGIGIVDAGDQPGSASARVKNVTFDSDGGGVSLGTFDTVVVENSRFLNNGTAISGSMSDATVSYSAFVGNQNAVYFDDASLIMSKSVVHRNGTGIACSWAHCELRDNAITKNQTGVQESGAASLTMTRNAVSRNDIGVDASGPCGVNLSHNAFVRNMTGVTLSYRAVGSVYRNAFTGNDVGLTSSNTNDGTSFMKAEKNVALFNRDGFYITGTGDQLGGNTAKWNSGWGIYAPNSVDLGGNKASANGSNPQCVGVICSQIR